MLQALELSEAQHQAIKSHCDAIGIEFFSTPFSIEAADLLVRLGVRRIKLYSRTAPWSNMPHAPACRC